MPVPVAVNVLSPLDSGDGALNVPSEVPLESWTATLNATVEVEGSELLRFARAACTWRQKMLIPFVTSQNNSRDYVNVVSSFEKSVSYLRFL